MSRRSLLLAALALAAAMEPAARADEASPAVAVLGVEVAGSAPVEPSILRDGIAQTLSSALTAAGYQVAEPATVDRILQRNRALAGCFAQDCLATLSAFLKVSRFVHAHVDAFGQSFSVALDLYATDRPESLVAHVEQKCDVCTLGELQQSVAQAVGTLHQRDVVPAPQRPAPQAVTVRSAPAGASIQLDGHPAGATDAVLYLQPGPHDLLLERAGFLPAARSITVAPDQPISIDVPLIASASGVEAATPDRPFRLWKWAAAGGAAALLATGLTFVSIDGTGTCGGPGQCPRVYDTGAAGYATIGLGLAAGAGAAALFLFDQSQGQSQVQSRGSGAQPAPGAAATIAPALGGAAASLSGTF